MKATVDVLRAYIIPTFKWNHLAPKCGSSPLLLLKTTELRTGSVTS